MNISSEKSEEFRVEQLAKDYENLNWLFSTLLDENFAEIRTFVKIMLELKHIVIVEEFCEIYDKIISELKTVEFQLVEKEQTRF